MYIPRFLTMPAVSRIPSFHGSQRSSIGRRNFHVSISRNAILMPYMSPLMTEGTITRWKKKEGESFVAGDVLLEIESHMVTIDVEAVQNGILGRILTPEGSQNVPVEQVIALVAKTRDELNLQIMPRTEELTSRLAAIERRSSPSFSVVESPKIHSPRRFLQASRSPRHVEASALLMSSTHFSALQHHHPHWHGRGDTAQGTNVRGMITSAYPSQHGSCPPSRSTTDQVEPSSTNNEDAESPGEIYPKGAELRRLILSSLRERSSTTVLSQDDTTSRYFDGLL